MARIRLLPDAVINQIAAGEVIERPASAVKELVENALDAAATRITVTLAAGGRDLIVVEDDGEGMDHDDLHLALERHATSKLTGVEGLAAIATLGFRGEALPSIAAASHLAIESAPAPGAGHRLEVAFGTLTASRPCSRGRGTRVEVRDLFLALPARRKFLRSPETELRHVVATLTALALARPQVALFLDHGSRRLLALPAATDLQHRLADLLGPRRASQAVQVALARERLHVTGFLLPGMSPRDSILLVNGRPVRDRLLTAAANRALHAPSGAPLGATWLHLELPADQVDVNVHPAKAEVRFADPGAVTAAVTAALAQARQTGATPPPVRRLVVIPTAPSPPSSSAPRLSQPPPVRASEATSPFSAPHPFGRLIGQYRNTYLLLEDEEGLLLVDQHAAHERVLFEELLGRSTSAPVQRLLLPEVVDLPPARALLACEHRATLDSLGFEIEEASGSSIRVLGLPAGLPPTEPAKLLRRILDDLADGVAAGDTPRQRLAASLACHAAIKKNRPLQPREAEELLRRLAATRDPHRCPHGRPVMIRLAHGEIEQRIGRR